MCAQPHSVRVCCPQPHKYYQYRDDPYYLFDYLGTPYVRWIQMIVGFVVIIVTSFTYGMGKKAETEQEDNDYVTMSVIE